MKAILFAIVLNVVVPLSSLCNPTTTSISFQLQRNLIVVHASANGKEGHFILDTGVSEVILNNNYFTGMSAKGKFYDINGTEMERKVQYIKFNLGGFERRVNAIVIDFTALEKATGLEVFGVIGNSFFTNCEVVLDYVFKEMTIYQLDKKGMRWCPKNLHQRPQDTLSFTMGSGVLFLEIDVNGQRLRMSVDSGATSNVMDINNMELLNSSYWKLMEGSLVGFAPEEIQIKTRIIDKMMVGKLSCPPMKTLFVNLENFNKHRKGKRVDGILGYEFLSNFRVAINFRKQEIYLWSRGFVEQQWAIASMNLEK